MKSFISQSIKQVVTSRSFVVLLSIFVLTCAAYCIYAAIAIQVSEVQVGVRYTSFGDTNYYRQRWYYLLSFVGFGLIIGIMHSLMAVKLFLQERRHIASLFVALSIFLVVIAWFITRAVFAVAFPS